MDVTNDQADSFFNTKSEHNIESEYNTKFDTKTDDQTESESKRSTNLILATATVPLSGRKQSGQAH